MVLKQRGFTLIEGVAILVIVTVCALALFKAVSVYNESMRQSGRDEVYKLWNAEKATQAENARKQESAWQAEKQGLLDANANLQKDRDAAKSKLNASTASLRLITDKYVALHSASNNSKPTDGSTSIAALGNSFNECTDQLGKMASELDDARARGSLAEALYDKIALKPTATLTPPKDKPDG